MVCTHPFPMTARFRSLLVLTYAFLAPVLQPLTAGLALDQEQGHGFVCIALVDVAGLRPGRLPAALGLDVRCIGYRIVVRASTATGRTRRGLYLLRTEMDRWPLQVPTRLLTHYRSARARISWQRDGDRLHVQARSRRGVTDLHLIADLGRRPAQPPAGSPFSSWAAARPFTGPLPWTFAPNPAGDAAVTVSPRSPPPGRGWRQPSSFTTSLMPGPPARSSRSSRAGAWIRGRSLTRDAARRAPRAVRSPRR